ncbi:MAG: DUF4259 domain-containing protein [Chloroflexi bacterium]|nr:DUF4259 domain-containing protein [Ardenticatenaceae bacterium]MBL1129365.1 DUF4259 domain-containing protein [Chloroflexota bacterium]NOG35444.1 DUF4259 domain-containing protein [Chloroflexota bacterium]GIK55311.1 MAG: hypothetical protein BroJett015_09740 [Chloroflexota bacterium]
MGTWGIGSFENDTAMDWLVDFEANDFRLIDRTLAGVAAMQAVDYLDADEACEVLAAAECVAAAAGFPAASLPDEIHNWVSANRPIQVKPDYVRMAITAVTRVRTHSELQALWAETNDNEAWNTAVADLQTRLRQIK